MEIIVTIKSVFGRTLIYPVCEKAEVFARIAGTASLTDVTIELIKELGYSITVEQGVTAL